MVLGCGGNGQKVGPTTQPSAELNNPVETTTRASSTLAVARPTQTAVATVPPPAPSPAAQWGTPIVGDVNLTGQVANDIPGTLVAVGANITSVVDKNTKPRDVYAISLMAGDVYHIDFTVDINVLSVVIANPESKSFDYDRFTGLDFCYYCSSDRRQFAPAVSGVYYLSVSTTWPAAQYTFRVIAL